MLCMPSAGPPQPASQVPGQSPLLTSCSVAFAVEVMGCGRSSLGVEPCHVAVCHVPESFPTPPEDVLPPDGNTHQMYIRQLNTYLLNVAKHPQEFKQKVETWLFSGWLFGL